MRPTNSAGFAINVSEPSSKFPAPQPERNKATRENINTSRPWSYKVLSDFFLITKLN